MVTLHVSVLSHAGRDVGTWIQIPETQEKCLSSLPTRFTNRACETRSRCFVSRKEERQVHPLSCISSCAVPAPEDSVFCSSQACCYALSRPQSGVAFCLPFRLALTVQHPFLGSQSENLSACTTTAGALFLCTSTMP